MNSVYGFREENDGDDAIDREKEMKGFNKLRKEVEKLKLELESHKTGFSTFEDETQISMDETQISMDEIRESMRDIPKLKSDVVLLNTDVADIKRDAGRLKKIVKNDVGELKSALVFNTLLESYNIIAAEVTNDATFVCTEPVSHVGSLFSLFDKNH